MSDNTSQIRDLLYFDFDKAASIWSQFAGGLREGLSVTADTGKDQSAGVKFGIPKFAEASLGTSYADKTSILETRRLHHDLLNMLEAKLQEVNLLIDVSQTVDPAEQCAETIRIAIGDYPYIRVTGASVIEDYQRIERIAGEFKKLTKFLTQCRAHAVKQTPEYQAIMQGLDSVQKDLQNQRDRRKKTTVPSQINALRNQVEQMTRVDGIEIDEWLLDGIRHWISTFVEHRLNFRVYPFLNCPECHIICNLKRDCFVDQDLEHLLYGYGTRPNVPLSVVGLITSLPQQNTPCFDPLMEFGNEKEMDDKRSFEKAIRGMFGGMDGIEDFMRYSRYPNITLHPIAVFRSFQLS